ncbi:MAG TPA: hypothetical protein VFY25_03945 [Anaerolineales bacterium]|nr:hypothetical protein [Anaerolineales bacterium]
MSTILNKIASVLAFIIGGMAIFAGGKVLLGIDPGYYVINWVPVYNYTMGILTVFITAILLWKNSRFATPAIMGTFSLHALVMLLLQTVFRDTVASESLLAMTLRLIVWAVILGLMFVRSRQRVRRDSRLPSHSVQASNQPR